MKIPFAATWGGANIACDGGDIALNDLRFYLSKPQLVDAEGIVHDLELHSDLPWQQSDLALIDLEDGQGSCAGGTRETFVYLSASAPPGAYRALRFTVGVPFVRNHSNPLTALAPLDDPAMHWHWRSGYKFVRAGVRSASDGFWIHVGSTGCEGTVRNITACRFPNRVTVELDGFVPNRDAVGIDLKALFGGVDFDDGVASDCSSGPSESTCTAPFAALGLDFETGESTGGQRVFSVQR